SRVFLFPLEEPPRIGSRTAEVESYVEPARVQRIVTLQIFAELLRLEGDLHAGLWAVHVPAVRLVGNEPNGPGARVWAPRAVAPDRKFVHAVSSGKCLLIEEAELLSGLLELFALEKGPGKAEARVLVARLLCKRQPFLKQVAEALPLLGTHGR